MPPAMNIIDLTADSDEDGVPPTGPAAAPVSPDSTGRGGSPEQPPIKIEVDSDSSSDEELKSPEELLLGQPRNPNNTGSADPGPVESARSPARVSPASLSLARVSVKKIPENEKSISRAREPCESRGPCGGGAENRGALGLNAPSPALDLQTPASSNGSMRHNHRMNSHDDKGSDSDSSLSSVDWAGPSTHIRRRRPKSPIVRRRSKPPLRPIRDENVNAELSAPLNAELRTPMGRTLKRKRSPSPEKPIPAAPAPCKPGPLDTFPAGEPELPLEKTAYGSEEDTAKIIEGLSGDRRKQRSSFEMAKKHWIETAPELDGRMTMDSVLSRLPAPGDKSGCVIMRIDDFESKTSKDPGEAERSLCVKPLVDGIIARCLQGVDCRSRDIFPLPVKGYGKVETAWRDIKRSAEHPAKNPLLLVFDLDEQSSTPTPGLKPPKPTTRIWKLAIALLVIVSERLSMPSLIFNASRFWAAIAGCRLLELSDEAYRKFSASFRHLEAKKAPKSATDILFAGHFVAIPATVPVAVPERVPGPEQPSPPRGDDDAVMVEGGDADSAKECRLPNENDEDDDEDEGQLEGLQSDEEGGNSDGESADEDASETDGDVAQMNGPDGAGMDPLESTPRGPELGLELEPGPGPGPGPELEMQAGLESMFAQLDGFQSDEEGDNDGKSDGAIIDALLSSPRESEPELELQPEPGLNAEPEAEPIPAAELEPEVVVDDEMEDAVVEVAAQAESCEVHLRKAIEYAERFSRPLSKADFPDRLIPTVEHIFKHKDPTKRLVFKCLQAPVEGGREHCVNAKEVTLQLRAQTVDSVGTIEHVVVQRGIVVGLVLRQYDVTVSSFIDRLRKHRGHAQAFEENEKRHLTRGIYQITMALNRLHGDSIFHFDIDEANIMVQDINRTDVTKEWRLIDFGAARTTNSSLDAAWLSNFEWETPESEEFGGFWIRTRPRFGHEDKRPPEVRSRNRGGHPFVRVDGRKIDVYQWGVVVFNILFPRYRFPPGANDWKNEVQNAMRLEPNGLRIERYYRLVHRQTENVWMEFLEASLHPKPGKRRTMAQLVEILDKYPEEVRMEHVSLA